MRLLTTILVALSACAPDAEPTPSTVPDAGTDLCPLAHAEGVVRAFWFADTGCAYQCAPATHQRCGDVWTDGRLTANGSCVPISDRRNCGACGRVCDTAEDCVRPAGSAVYVCLGRLR